jgi:demethylmenaquinone methyltransferase/2-methoxy-6-polyprenyl-1,4-benzoquinol methylase
MTVDKSNQRVQRMFGEIAPKYDMMNHLLSMNVDRYWRWRAVRIVAARRELPILDVCAGTGDLAFAFRRQTRGRIPIIATDFCPEMLEIAESKMRKARIDDGLTFVEADAQELPFEDGHFQIVAVAFGLRNVADTDRGISEMVRVCCRGGQVAILEFSTPIRQPVRALYGWYFRHVLPRIGRIFTQSTDDAYDYLPSSVREFPSGEALAERMRTAGLVDLRLYPLTFGIATLYVGVKP